MMEILKYPEPKLRAVATRVGEGFWPKAKEISKEMLRTMYRTGLGLSAPQVDWPIRLIVLDTEWTTDGKKDSIVAINPTIVWRSSEKVTASEACLSLPGFEAEIERHASIRVQYYDQSGKFMVKPAAGLLSACFQHEMDHLDGILLIDRISRLKRSLYVKKVKKRAKRAEA